MFGCKVGRENWSDVIPFHLDVFLDAPSSVIAWRLAARACTVMDVEIKSSPANNNLSCKHDDAPSRRKGKFVPPRDE